jgi:hypothetical protein
MRKISILNVNGMHIFTMESRVEIATSGTQLRRSTGN